MSSLASNPCRPMEHSALGPHVSLCPAPELSVVVMCEHSMVHPLHKRSLSPLQWCSPRKVLVARKHVEEEILTSKCPRCRAAFLDFDGCCALQVRDSSIRLSTRNQKPKPRNSKPEIQCSNCPCNFCAWCGADCGGADAAHRHVAACGAKPAGADVFFPGSPAEFQKAQVRCSQTRNPKPEIPGPKSKTRNRKP